MIKPVSRPAALALVVTAALCAWTGATATSATSDAQRRPTFAADIAPIILSRCASCHRPGQAAPFPLLSYDDVRAKGPEIAEMTGARLMPPWHATQGPGFPALIDDRRLSDRQVEVIRTWVKSGMPSGDLRKAPALPILPAPWPLGVPELTIALPHVVGVPAGGSVELHNVVIPVGVPADVWVSAIDYLPTSAALRHARFFLAPPDLPVRNGDVLPGVGGLLGGGSLENYGDQVLAAGSTLVDLGGWTPGIARRFLPEGLAIRIPARSSLVMQLHMRSGETDAVEDGRLAIYFAKPDARRAIVPVDVPPALGIASGLLIPAGEAKHVLTDSFVLPIDVEAVGARGHAHYLGREMTMTATLPKGATRGLLKLTRWDVDWPDLYLFAAPVHLPKGTTIAAEIVYDNSAANLRNLFSPPRAVGWGRLGVGEMGSMGLLITAPSAGDTVVLDEARAAHLRAQLMKGRRR